MFLSSADWMPRNFERRVEVMFPVEAEDLRRRIVEEIIPTYLSDNRRTRDAAADGTYCARRGRATAPPHRSQIELLALAASRDRRPRPKRRLPLSFDAHLETVAEATASRARRAKAKEEEELSGKKRYACRTASSAARLRGTRSGRWSAASAPRTAARSVIAALPLPPPARMCSMYRAIEWSAKWSKLPFAQAADETRASGPSRAASR